MRGRKVDKPHLANSYGNIRLRTERRGNQCSEARAELEGLANGPIATSDSISTKHFEIGSRKSKIENSVEALFHATTPAALISQLTAQNINPAIIAIDCPRLSLRAGPKTRLAEKQLHKMGFRVQ